jgi:RimJ/RimL family protein N-acetyltransferase
MIKMYIPKYEDLWFREKMMSDQETMSYNHAWGGTIPFPESKWRNWYEKWIKSTDGKKFYRYLLNDKNHTFIGETAYHYDEQTDMYMADVIVYAEYRGNGYGRQGLRLLCEAASDNGIEVLHDDIAIDNPAVKMFIQNGFHEEYRTDEIVMLKKVLRKCGEYDNGN